MMKTTLLFLSLGSFSIGAFGQNAIPNGAFENWTSTQVENPKYYTETSNQETFRNGLPLNCEKTSDAYHGSYAIKLTSVGNSNNSIPGYLVNGNPDNNPSDWHGGIPYAQQANGLRGYYKSNVVAGDTALVLVAFSKAGVNIGVYAFKFSGVQSTYTLFDFTFDPPLPVAPDSVMFGAASSNVLADYNAIGSMLQLDSISFTGVNSQPTQLNGDFEEWETINYEMPAMWYMESDQSQVSFKSTDAYKGTYSVRLNTSVGQNDQGIPRSFPTTMSTGYYAQNCNNCLQQGGYPFTQQSDTLVFWYTYTSVGGAKGALSYTMKKNGQNIHGSYMELDAASSFQKIEVPLSVGQTPDTLILSFHSCRWEDSLVNQSGSFLVVDEVQLKSAPLKTGLWSKFRTTAIQVYPNPNNGVVYIDMDGQNLGEQSEFVLIDALGQEVFTSTLLEPVSRLELGLLPAGVYYFTIRNGAQKVQSGRLILQNEAR